MGGIEDGPGSGATRLGVFFRGAERSTCIGSSSEGAMLVTADSERCECQSGVSIVSRCIFFGKQVIEKVVEWA